MELFPSADDEQWEFIKREIDSSDYYIVIVAGKYGSLAPDGLSFTEKEYDYAVSAGKPVMGFVYKDLPELKGAKLEEDRDLREKILAFRAKVGKGKLVKFYQNPDELKAQVLHSLMRTFKLSPKDGWIRAKHARRMEDLEQINLLQKRVMELEAENAILKKRAIDPREMLAQGNDAVRYTLKLQATSSTPDENRAPAEEFVLEATWDSLLRACFVRNTTGISTNRVGDVLTELARPQLATAFPNHQDWVNDHNIDLFDPSSLYGFINAIEIQFLGTGHIVVEDRRTSNFWKPTEKGLVCVSLLCGSVRSTSTE